VNASLDSPFHRLGVSSRVGKDGLVDSAASAIACSSSWSECSSICYSGPISHVVTPSFGLAP
jgi:hypothetical protein